MDSEDETASSNGSCDNKAYACSMRAKSMNAATCEDRLPLAQRQDRRSLTCQPLDLCSLEASPSDDVTRELNRRASQRGSLRLRFDLALTAGEALKRLEDGQTGGVYSVETWRAQDEMPTSVDKLAVFKPESEEGFSRRGIPAGGGAVREEAAYLIDRLAGYVAKVPVTTRVEVPEKALEATSDDGGSPLVRASSEDAENSGRSSGAVQRFVQDVAGPSEDFGMPRRLPEAIKMVAVSNAQHVACLDIRLCNTDRHPGNLLFQNTSTDAHPAFKEPKFLPIPIDHGCILPCWWAMGEANFGAWMDWPQIHAPVAAEVLEAIATAHDRRDNALELLAELGVAPAAQATYRIGLALLRETTVRHGLTIAVAAGLMSRDPYEFEKPSWIEEQMVECAVALGFNLDWDTNAHGDRILATPADPMAWPFDGLVEKLEANFCSDATLCAGRTWENDHGLKT